MLAYLTDPYTVIDRPLWWHTQGRQETASGYGRRLTSRYCVQIKGDPRVRRVYITCFGNAGSAWILRRGQRLYLYS